MAATRDMGEAVTHAVCPGTVLGPSVLSSVPLNCPRLSKC